LLNFRIAYSPPLGDIKGLSKKPKLTPLQAKMTTPHLKRMSPIRGAKEETSTISLLIALCL
jgi:hypothetical protein